MAWRGVDHTSLPTAVSQIYKMNLCVCFLTCVLSTVQRLDKAPPGLCVSTARYLYARVLLTKTEHGLQLAISILIFFLMHVSFLILCTVYVYSVYRLCVCVLFCVPFMFMYYSVYCLCVFCVLYNCQRMSAHLQFINNNNNNNLQQTQKSHGGSVVNMTILLAV